jgi:hypothetical protein
MVLSRLMLPRVVVSIGIGGVVVIACSGSPSTPTDYCNRLAATLCSRLYSCATGSALDLIKAKYGDTVDQCTTFERGDLNCSNATCDEFSGASAQSCLDAYNAETCDNISAGTVPSVCSSVCTLSSADGASDVAAKDVGTIQCGGGLTLCGGDCADLSADESNCGSCGAPCTSSQFCSQGVCKTGTCKSDNSSCTFDSDCCKNWCSSTGICACIPSGTAGCMSGADCCSGTCTNGICQ